MVTDIVPLLRFIKHVPCMISVPGHCVVEACPQPPGAALFLSLSWLSECRGALSVTTAVDTSIPCHVRQAFALSSPPDRERQES